MSSCQFCVRNSVSHFNQQQCKYEKTEDRSYPDISRKFTYERIKGGFSCFATETDSVFKLVMYRYNPGLLTVTYDFEKKQLVEKFLEKSGLTNVKIYQGFIDIQGHAVKQFFEILRSNNTIENENVLNCFIQLTMPKLKV